MKRKIYLALIALLMSSSSLSAENNGTVEIVSTSYQRVMVKDENGTLVETWPRATKVIPGTIVKYADIIVNTTDDNITAVKVSNPINANLVYIADSAISELNATILYSIDGGKSFDEPDNLKIVEGDHNRTALPEEYNGVQWSVDEIPHDTNCTVEFRVKLK